MTKGRICATFVGGALALVTLCYAILHGSADMWLLILSLVTALIVSIWWMIDRTALERRIRRLEACSEIADERRVSAQASLTKFEHRVREIEGRVGDVESFAALANEAQGNLVLHKTANRTGFIPL